MPDDLIKKTTPHRCAQSFGFLLIPDVIKLTTNNSHHSTHITQFEEWITLKWKAWLTRSLTPEQRRFELTVQCPSPLTSPENPRKELENLCELSKASQRNPDMESQGVKHNWPRVLSLLQNWRVYQNLDFFFKANQTIFCRKFAFLSVLGFQKYVWKC